jgi:hypothetical protein
MMRTDDAEQPVIDILRCLGNDVLHDGVHCKQSQRIEQMRAKECNMPKRLKKTPLAHEAEKKSKSHCVGAGAPRIAGLVNRVFSDQGSYLIDFMHHCEYLASASSSCCSHDSLAWQV